jgi:hypothetical protein
MEGLPCPDLTIRPRLSMAAHFLLLPILLRSPLRPRNLPPKSILSLGLSSRRSLSRKQRFMAGLRHRLLLTRHIESL